MCDRALWPDTWTTIQDIIDNNLRQEMETYYNTLNRKLDRIQGKQKRATSHTPHGWQQQTYPRMVNLTNIQFTIEEQSILDLGLQYSLQKPSASAWTTLALETQRAIRLLDNKIQDSFRILATKQLKRLHNTNQNDTTYKGLYVLKQIRQKFTQGNAMIARADKGKTVVIIYTQDYTDKLHTFLSENNSRTQPHTQRPENHTQGITTVRNYWQKTHQYLIQKTPSPPTLNALLKLHKPNTPIRPVVNNRTAPTYKAAKKLNTILNNHLHLDNQYNITNSNTLAKDLTQLKISNKHRLLTLDIKDLYVNIPIKETIHITENQLTMHNDKHIANQIIKLLETILAQNYFTFQNQIYQPDKGIAMGSPISGTVAEIFLQQLEKTHIKHLIDSKQLIFYARYVDNILIIYDSSLTSPTNIQHYMDTIHDNIKLNATHETNDTVIFLGLSIIRKPTSLELDIYRKPILTDTTINFLSNHPLEHKLAAYRFSIFPSPQ